MQEIEKKISIVEVRLSNVEEGLKDHKMEDAYRFDNATAIQQEFAKKFDMFSEDLREWKQNQLAMSSLIKQTNDNMVELRKTFNDDMAKSLKKLCSGDTVDNLISLGGWYSASNKYGKPFIRFIVAVILGIAGVLAAFKTIAGFFK